MGIKGLILFKKTSRLTKKCITAFDVKCGGIEDQITSLSGGNIQKFITGREILQEPDLIVISQPTWGVDVGAAKGSHSKYPLMCHTLCTNFI